MRIFLISLLLLLQACASTPVGVTAQTFVGKHPSEEEIAKEDFDTVIGLVLRHENVAKHVLPALGGQVPVRVVFLPPFDGRPVNLQLYGSPVVTGEFKNEHLDAIILSMACGGDDCSVAIIYKPAGIDGLYSLVRTDGQWRVRRGCMLYPVKSLRTRSSAGCT